MIDYHVHSNHSGDAESTITEYCRRAIELGIKEIGFTDHLDFDVTDICYDCLIYDDFMRDIDKARSEFGGRFTIRAGVEVDYRPSFHEKIERWLNGKDFDYIIGSAHYVHGILLENHEQFFPGKDMFEAYLPYFDVTESVIKSGLFDVLAHIDLCKRYGTLYYGRFPVDTFKARIIELLEMVIDSRMVLEVNTSGLRQAPNDTYPSMDIVNLYRELGGKYVTIGSDAHRAVDLGNGINETLDKLKSAGLTVWQV